MSIGNVNFELESGSVGMGLRKASQTVDHSDFTKSTQYGTLAMTETIPEGAFIIGTKVTVTEAFNGGSNNLIVGTNSNYTGTELSDGTTIEVGTVDVVGDTATDPLGYLAAETTIYLRIDEASDWDDVTAGNMKVEVFYLSSVLELP